MNKQTMIERAEGIERLEKGKYHSLWIHPYSTCVFWEKPEIQAERYFEYRIVLPPELAEKKMFCRVCLKKTAHEWFKHATFEGAPASWYGCSGCGCGATEAICDRAEKQNRKKK